LLRDLEDGLVVADDGYTVAQAVEDWLTHGLSNRTRRRRRSIGAYARGT